MKVLEKNMRYLRSWISKDETWWGFQRSVPFAKTWIGRIDSGHTIVTAQDLASRCGLDHDEFSDRDIGALNDAIANADGMVETLIDTCGQHRRTLFLRALPVGDHERRVYLSVEDRSTEHALNRQLAQAREMLVAAKLAKDVGAGDALHLALTDPLTGLPNRRAFDLALDDACNDGQFTLCLIDMDDFKAINDRLGHSVGDTVLAAVGARLRAHVRGVDVVSRIAGDEFAVIFPGVATTDAAHSAAERITAAFRTRLPAGEFDLSVRMTLGVAVVDAPADRDAVYRRADVMLHTAKSTAKGTVAVHKDDNENLEEFEILAGLRRMLQRNEVPLVLSEVADRKGRTIALTARLASDAALQVDDDGFFSCAARFGIAGDLIATFLTSALVRAKSHCPGLALHLTLPHSAIAHTGADRDVLQALSNHQARARAVAVKTPAAEKGSAVERTLRALEAAGVARVLADWDLGLAALASVRPDVLCAVTLVREQVAPLLSREDGRCWVLGAVAALPPPVCIYLDGRTGTRGPSAQAFNAGVHAQEHPHEDAPGRASHLRVVNG